MTDIRRTLLWGFSSPRCSSSGSRGTGTTASRRCSGPRRAATTTRRPAARTAPSTRLPATPATAAAPAPPQRQGAGERRRAPVDRRERSPSPPTWSERPSTPKAPTSSAWCCCTSRSTRSEPWYASFLDLFGAGGPPPQSHDVELFDQSAAHYYVAQTGLWPSAAGPGALPEHHTVMALVSSERTLKDGANELQLRFESPVQGGVKLVKTYTFRRGDYVIGVAHQIVNESAAPVSPRLYLQLVARRQRGARRHRVLFDLHRPGDLHRYAPLQQDRVQGDREARGHRQGGARDRSQRLGRDGPALLRDGLAGRQAGGAGLALGVLHRQGRRQHLFGRHARAARPDRRRRDQGLRRQAVRRPAGRGQARGARAGPRAGQGLRLASRSSPSRCSGC